MYTRGWGQARVWAAPIAPQWVQLHECNSGTWVHWIYAGVPVKTTSERHQSSVPACPWLGGAKSSANMGSHETHSTWAHPKVNIPREAILSGFSPSGCAPILAALTTDQNHSKETDLGALLHQPGSRSHHRQGSDSHRAKGKLPSISRGGWGHNNSNQSPDPGVKGPSLWTNLTGQGEDNRARGARIRQPAEQTTNPENVTKWEDKEVWCRGRSKTKSYKNH